MMFNSKKINNKIILSWAAVVIWMMLIFSLSAQPSVQSDGLSRNVTKIIIETIGRVIPFDVETSTVADLVTQFNNIVRKFAHFFAYLILGLLVNNSFTKSGVRGRKAFVYSLLFCMLYAASDEFHQLFVPGRGGRLKDVMIDSSGALVGIMLCELYRAFRKMSKA